MKHHDNYGSLLVIPIKGMITPEHMVPPQDVFVATERSTLVVTERNTNVIAKDYV